MPVTTRRRDGGGMAVGELQFAGCTDLQCRVVPATTARVCTQGRPPSWDPKPAPGDFDYGGITFVGPLLANYTVGAVAVLARNAAGLFWCAARARRAAREAPAPLCACCALQVYLVFGICVCSRVRGNAFDLIGLPFIARRARTPFNVSHTRPTRVCEQVCLRRVPDDRVRARRHARARMCTALSPNRVPL